MSLSPETSGPFEKGAVIGKFRLDVLIGRGGFGEVWRAQEELEGEKIGLACAIKMMHYDAKRSGSNSNEIFKSTWVQEINALKSMKHDAIPRTIDGGFDEKTKRAFIAMELLDGETLADRITRRPLGWRRALVIAGHIASALDMAHAREIVHRDLKPQNVFLEKNGRVCVIDWGIARFTRLRSERLDMPERSISPVVLDGGTADFSTEEMQALVKEKRANNAEKAEQIVGTPGYMAPEVLAGNDATAAVDAYALGVVLFQCLTGRLPYRIAEPNGKTGPSSASDVLQARAARIWDATLEGELIPIDELVPDLPSGVCDLVKQLLSKDPQARGAGDLAKLIMHVNRFPHGVPNPPYAGLDAFGAERAGFLFGRDTHIDRIVARLKDQKALVLSGPSGCGKSSLAVAGVAARIDHELLDGTDGWRLLVVRPSEPKALEAVLPNVTNATDAKTAPLGTMIVVDQLEEVLNLDIERQTSFCAGLAELAAAKRAKDVLVREGMRITREMPIRVLATVREDFEWQVVRIEALRELCETSRCLVTGVDATSARELVEEPAKALGYRLENADTAIREVETSLATDATALPIVQFALTEWWARRDDEKKNLPAKAWQELGGVDGALSYVADRHYRNLVDDDKKALRDLFGRLLLGDRKLWVNAASLKSENERRLMDELVELRLVKRRDESEGRAGYEMAHESLAKRWDVLKQWISERAAEDAHIVDVQADARLWVRQGKPANRLRLDMVVPAHVRLRLEAEALEYVDASMEAKRAAEIAAEKQAAEIAQQKRRRRIYTVVIVGLVSVIALMATYAVQISRKEAEKSAALLEAQLEKAAAKTANEALARARAAELQANVSAVLANNAKEEVEKERNQRKADYDALEKRIAEAKSVKELEAIRKEIQQRRETPTTAPSPVSTTGSAANPMQVEPPF